MFLIKDVRMYIILFQEGKTLKKYKDVRLAIMKGHLPIIIHNYASIKRELVPGYMHTAARYRHLHIIKWFYKQTGIYTDAARRSAIRRGYTEIVKWCRDLNRIIGNSYGI